MQNQGFQPAQAGFACVAVTSSARVQDIRWVERSRKACGIAPLRAHPLPEKPDPHFTISTKAASGLENQT